MGLIYGKLTQQFVNFGVLTAQARDGNATAAALIPPAAEYFRTVSSHDASYLVYMGKCTLAVNCNIGQLIAL